MTPDSPERAGTVKPNHPLAEVIARKIFGWAIVPDEEKIAMMRRAIAAAVDYHESALLKAREEGRAEERERCIKIAYSLDAQTLMRSGNLRPAEIIANKIREGQAAYRQSEAETKERKS